MKLRLGLRRYRRSDQMIKSVSPKIWLLKPMATENQNGLKTQTEKSSLDRGLPVRHGLLFLFSQWWDTYPYRYFLPWGLTPKGSTFPQAVGRALVYKRAQSEILIRKPVALGNITVVT